MTQQAPDMNLTLTIHSKAGTQTFHFTRGDRALAELRHWDEEPFTVCVTLTNRVPTGKVIQVPATREVPAHEEPEYQDVLVWQSVDTMPRWTTALARTRERLRRQTEAARLLETVTHGEGR